MGLKGLHPTPQSGCRSQLLWSFRHLWYSCFNKSMNEYEDLFQVLTILIQNQHHFQLRDPPKTICYLPLKQFVISL